MWNIKNITTASVLIVILEICQMNCVKNRLSVIVSSGQKGITHYEWQMAKAGTSWKAQMKYDMDTTIRIHERFEIENRNFGQKNDQSLTDVLTKRNYDKLLPMNGIYNIIAAVVVMAAAIVPIFIIPKKNHKITVDK